jgi:hypothetical protein
MQCTYDPSVLSLIEYTSRLGAGTVEGQPYVNVMVDW